MNKRIEHFAVYRHRARPFAAFPLICVLQAEMLAGPEAIMCPVGISAETGPTTPVVEIMGVRYVIYLRKMAAFPVRVLGERVGSAEGIRPAIGNALDRIFFGI